MHLHRRRGQQDQSSGPVFQALHQAEQRVRSAFLLASRPAPPGMVGFVEHHQIPRLGICQQRRRAVVPTQQMTRRNHHGFEMPVIAVDIALVSSAPRRGPVPGQLAAVVDRPIEVELLAQFNLPLFEDGLGRQDQDPCGTPGQPCLAQQHARLDGLAEADLVGDQQPRWPMAVEALKRSDLVWPGGDRRGGFADALASVRPCRGLLDERPDTASQIVGVGRDWRRGCLSLGCRRCH